MLDRAETRPGRTTTSDALDPALAPILSIARPKPLAGVPHPIPYQGSKRQLAAYIVALFPTRTNRLIEAFAGSAAVSLAAGHLRRVRRWWINDLHEPLMNLWREIISSPENLSDRYERIWQTQLDDPRVHYDRVRARFNRSHRPEDFLYLLARCVKAAIRYNSKGEFNNSPDNRRLGAAPATMRRHVYGAASIFADRSVTTAVDYREVLESARIGDLVYMDPPYQGVVDTHNHRYRHGLSYSEFCQSLEALRRRGIPFIVSYDGRTGNKRFGQTLPPELGLVHIELPAGRSTQATLLGRDDHTFESLYLSPEIPFNTSRLREGPAPHLNSPGLFEGCG